MDDIVKEDLLDEPVREKASSLSFSQLLLLIFIDTHHQNRNNDSDTRNFKSIYI